MADPFWEEMAKYCRMSGSINPATGQFVATCTFSEADAGGLSLYAGGKVTIEFPLDIGQKARLLHAAQPSDDLPEEVLWMLAEEVGIVAMYALPMAASMLDNLFAGNALRGEIARSIISSGLSGLSRQYLYVTRNYDAMQRLIAEQAQQNTDLERLLKSDEQ